MKRKENDVMILKIYGSRGVNANEVYQQNAEKLYQ